MNTPRPEDFFGDTPPPRIIGTECECNIQLTNDSSQASYISKGAINRAGYKNTNGLLANGAKLYVDLEHLEVDSAEALGPGQAAAADLATIGILTRIVKASGVEHKGLHRHSGTFLLSKEKTSGYHESYGIPRAIAGSGLIDTIVASHLASRIYAWGGTVKSGFHLSQKVKGIGNPPITRIQERRTSETRKPMAMIPPEEKDRDTIGNPDWARLEVRFADPGLNRNALFLSFATTSLALRIVEQSRKLELDELLDLTFKDKVAAAQLFSRDLTFSETAETLNGNKISAANFQEILFQTAYELSQKVELPKEERQAIMLGFLMCDELRAADLTTGEYGRLPLMTHFAPRHQYLTSRYPLDRLHSGNRRAVSANLSIDRILPEGGAMRAWAKIVSPFVSEEMIKEFEDKAPPTRAQARGKLIAQGASFANWARVDLPGGKRIDLPDPYATAA